MSIIEQIKAEIERLKGICTAQIKANPGQTFPFVMEMTGYDKLLSFLSTLESEKPMNPDLEKELARFYLKDLCGSEKDEIPEATLHHNFPIMWDDLRDIARHFAEWGYLRAAEKYNEVEYNRQRTEESVPKDLEEAASEYSTNEADRVWGKPDPHDYTDHSGCGAAHDNYEVGLQVGFKAGSKWQKQQDEKEQADLFTIVALDAAQRAREQMMKEAVEGEITKDNRGNNVIRAGVFNNGFEIGNKVRVIVMKKDNEQ